MRREPLGPQPGDEVPPYTVCGKSEVARAPSAEQPPSVLPSESEIGMRRPTPLSQYLYGLQVDGLGPRKEVGREEE